MTCAIEGVEMIMDSFKHELDVKRLIEKMPEYNVEYSIELAYNVNDVAIKSYDIKKDDNILFDKQLFDEDNEEPSGPGKDPFKIDKVKLAFREKIIPAEESVDRNSNSS